MTEVIFTVQLSVPVLIPPMFFFEAEKEKPPLMHKDIYSCLLMQKITLKSCGILVFQCRRCNVSEVGTFPQAAIGKKPQEVHFIAKGKPGEER